MNISGKLPRWLVLALCLLIGGLLIGFAPYSPWEWSRGAAKGFGEALAVFAFLAFTIERWFRQEFARDVFYAGLGAQLRPEFQDELRWITSFTWLARNALCRVKLEELGDGVVKLTLEMAREYENISSEPQKLHGYVGIDEWGVPGYQSTIEKCGLIKDGKTTQATEKKAKDMHRSWATKEVWVEPGEKIKTFAKSVEYRRSNDQHVVALVYPIKDPEVELEAPDSLVAQVGFTHRGSSSLETEPLRGKKTLKGTLLPSQVLIFRWWPKADVRA